MRKSYWKFVRARIKVGYLGAINLKRKLLSTQIDELSRAAGVVTVDRIEIIKESDPLIFE